MDTTPTKQNPHEDIQRLYNQNQVTDTRHLKPEASNEHQESSNQHRASSIQNPAPRTRPFVIPIFIPHAGCPHQCIFCNQVSITGAKQEAVASDKSRIQIRKFLKYKKTDRKPVQIAFFGGNFLGLKEEVIVSWLELANEFIHRRDVDSIRLSTRPDTIDPMRLDILENYPVSTVELGIQSMDDNVLALAGRGHDASDTVRAVKLLKERHFSIGLQMMVGLPGDDETRSLKTASRIVDLIPHFVRIYPTVVLKNSRLAEWYKNGDYTPLSLEECVSLVKKIYLHFKKENIDVIRMGLQASEDLEKGSVVLAGPYHPAFGHQVYSAIFYDAAKAAIESTDCLSDGIAIYVNPRSVSKMRGLNNSNIKLLKTRYHFKSIEVVPDTSLAEDEVNLSIER